ncbi:unnamed protein product, partial [Trichogramma brassicae]
PAVKCHFSEYLAKAPPISVPRKPPICKNQSLPDTHRSRIRHNTRSATPEGAIDLWIPKHTQGLSPKDGERKLSLPGAALGRGSVRCWIQVPPSNRPEVAQQVLLEIVLPIITPGKSRDCHVLPRMATVASCHTSNSAARRRYSPALVGIERNHPMTTVLFEPRAADLPNSTFTRSMPLLTLKASNISQERLSSSPETAESEYKGQFQSTNSILNGLLESLHLPPSEYSFTAIRTAPGATRRSTPLNILLARPRFLRRGESRAIVGQRKYVAGSVGQPQPAKCQLQEQEFYESSQKLARDRAGVSVAASLRCWGVACGASTAILNRESALIHTKQPYQHTDVTRPVLNRIHLDKI